MKRKQVSFEVSREVSLAIWITAARYDELRERLGLEPVDRLSLVMDLTACHANGMPIDWARLNAADDTTLAHDVGGIQAHINRQTGEIEDCFFPRCAAKQP